ncbi:MAG: hypothetical protein WBB60_18105 [Nitrospira sp.]|jgi:hypothetical protein|nr:hypothetical protein [Nitrospira sp.]MBP6605361.1 hypothetical protein [Nitrospira sp.]HQY59576.1 hypothetical protein [Nitrospira sp.]HRA95679.1 hypothetical protein [Nitrospira sp.]
MASKQAFWNVPAKDGEPDLWVCMSCLNEAFCRKVPMPACPSCQGVSTYEAFTLAAVQDWGTEELIAKAVAAQRDEATHSAAAAATPPMESVQ